MKTVGTKLDNSEYDIFEFCCSENGFSKSEQLRDLIKGFVNNKTECQVDGRLFNPTVERKIPEVSVTRIFN